MKGSGFITPGGLMELSYIVDIPESKDSKKRVIHFHIDINDLVGFSCDQKLFHENTISLTFKGGHYKNTFTVAPYYEKETIGDL